MKTLIRSINRSPLRCGFFTLTIALCWFALSPPLKAVDCPSTCPGGGNTGVGAGALDSVNPATGINNTAMGTDALTDDTSGSYNVAIGNSALGNNTTGQQNMAIGAEALANSNGNFNMAIGFRALFMNTGSRNSGVGAAALRNNAHASDNTAIGSTALKENTVGEENTAVGSAALASSNTGGDNTAVGFSAMGNAAGSNVVFNTAVGIQALQSTTANANVAVGDLSLLNDTSGDFNTAIGAASGLHQTTGSGNVYIGQGVEGVAGENNHTYIKNINSTSVNGAGTDFVTVNLGTGLLGHVSSSRRYKEDIKPMDNSSGTLYRLNPVTYRFKKEIDPSQSLEYGLVAEDVAQVDPNLAIRDGKGQIEGVRYTAVNAMLLNEFLKAHKKMEQQQASIAELKNEVQTMVAQLKEQAAQIQKVSAQVEVTNPAPQVVVNKP